MIISLSIFVSFLFFCFVFSFLYCLFTESVLGFFLLPLCFHDHHGFFSIKTQSVCYHQRYTFSTILTLSVFQFIHFPRSAFINSASKKMTLEISGLSMFSNNTPPFYLRHILNSQQLLTMQLLLKFGYKQPIISLFFPYIPTSFICSTAFILLAH